MISINLLAPHELQTQIASNLRAKRLGQNLTQQTLSARSGVSYGVLKKFELTGQISLSSLLKLAAALGALEDFNGLFAKQPAGTLLTLDQLANQSSRKRGRK